MPTTNAVTISNYKEDENGNLTFTLSNIDVCFANALRRTIMTDIPMFVFKTSPQSMDKSTVYKNTSHLHNELIKQRLSCIPIHLDDLNTSMENLTLEIKEVNKTDTTMLVTSEHFKVKNKTTNVYMNEEYVRALFPPFIAPTNGVNYYIELVRLKPELSPELPGEELYMTCDFSIGSARQNSSFNATGTCGYGFTPDRDIMAVKLEQQKQEWKDEGKNEEQVKREARNWELLEGLRNVVKNSFDFTLNSVGVYTNNNLLIMACELLMDKLKTFQNVLDSEGVSIAESQSTMDNCYDVILSGEGHTLGNILNYVLYSTYYNSETKILSYVGFVKMHPHDNDSIIRIAFIDSASKEPAVKDILTKTLAIATNIISSVKTGFTEYNK